MMGLLVAVGAVCLGAFGPRFRWRGMVLLLAMMVVAGIAATLAAAADAHAAGWQFRVTPLSLALGLAAQAVFVLAFYGLAALARWCHGELTRGWRRPRPDETAG